MFQIRPYIIISSFAFSLAACNHENEPAPSTGTDADARAPSASDAVPADNAQNFDTSSGGTISQAGDVPETSGGTNLAGTGGGVGRSANDGKDAPSTIGKGK
ncbi:MAG TPA: hypothetical protein VEQ58_00730 [Polyangiaceae bacterium]|nr:hypothetical protein [Polyangiaceae bacterium]